MQQRRGDSDWNRPGFVSSRAFRATTRHETPATLRRISQMDFIEIVKNA